MARLEQETKKKKPFDLPSQEVVLNVLRSNELFQHRFGQLFREFGLTQPQYNALRILRGEGGPLPCLEVASRMIAVVPAITRLLDKLNARGLITKLQDDKDRRVWNAKITPKGLELLAKLDAPIRDMYRALCGHLTKSESKQLVSLLEKARDRVSSVTL
ncbi:MAG: MarR family transcriptional regulator [Planctomycetota bacterium]|nr:MarR family transcriptional regulator [Planctomycetota bacterium]